MKKYEKLLVKFMEEYGDRSQACSKAITGQNNLHRLWAKIADVKKYITKVEKLLIPPQRSYK